MATATWNQQRQRDNGRGRDARSPTEIPATGWKDTLVRVKNDLKTDHISMISGAMAYYCLFAMVPAITAIVLMYAWFSDPAEISQHIAKASQFIPAELQEILKTQLGGLASQKSKLGFGAIAALFLALWGASKASKAVMEAMNIIYEEEDKRGFFKKNLLALSMTLLAIVMGILALGVIVLIPAITNMFNFGPAIEVGATIASWVILLALFSFFLSFAYRYGPDRQRAKWKWVSTGAVIAAVLWAIVSALFSWYAKEFGNFNKTYGSLGAMIVLMTWFYLSSFVILLGGEINAELEHQTKRDSTTGKEKPMGTRGAEMADTLGESAPSRKARA